MSSLFVLLVLLVTAQVQAEPHFYVCYSPQESEAWKVRVSANNEGGSWQAQIMTNPEIDLQPIRPLGEPLNVKQRATTSPGQILFQGRDFSLAMNTNDLRTMQTAAGPIEVFGGQLDGSLPFEKRKMQFRSLQVTCKVVAAMHVRPR